jgi:hypothetical protein
MSRIVVVAVLLALGMAGQALAEPPAPESVLTAQAVSGQPPRSVAPPIRPPARLQQPARCVPTETPERSCADGLDNDCDRLVDAGDPDCRPCPPGQFYCAASRGCLMSCSTCTAATYACPASGRCTPECTRDCGGAAACPLNALCVPACANCTAAPRRCQTSSGALQCVQTCTGATCPAPATCY